MNLDIPGLGTLAVFLCASRRLWFRRFGGDSSRCWALRLGRLEFHYYDRAWRKAVSKS